MATDNYRKHTSGNPLQRFLVNRFYDVLIGSIRGLLPSSILDAGCGEGFTLMRLYESGLEASVEGIELNPKAIEIARKLYPNLWIRQGSLYDLPYESGSFDLVLCSEVLEHLENPEQALSELCRVAKRFCVISVPNEPWFQLANFLRGKNLARWGNDIEHIQHWTPAGIRRLAEQHLKIRSVKTPFPWTILVGEKV